MELLHLVLRVVHLTAGVAALALFWVPALTKKGGDAHRSAGRWYVRAMTFITVTGVVLAQFYLYGNDWWIGAFLMFLGIITGTSLWNGWRVLQAKRNPAAYYTRAHVAVALLNLGAGATMIAVGLLQHMTLLWAFGPVGFIIGGFMLGRLRRRSRDPKYWLYEHFGGMIGSGIASHVAFLAFGGRRLFGWGLDGYALLAWLAPVAIGTVAITALNVHYRTKFAGAARETAAA